MQASNYATEGKEIGVQDTTIPVNRQAVQATADVLAVGKDYLNTRTVQGFEQQERGQYEGYVDYTKAAGVMQEGIRLQEEAKQRTLTAEENARVAEFENMAKMDADAYAQGIRKRNDYQLSAQRRLRSAIMQRPDLADEFRRVSAREIGTDVSSFALQYYWENLDAAGKALQTKPVTYNEITDRTQAIEKYIKTLPAEQQAEYASTTQREVAILMGKKDFEGASKALAVWGDRATGSPVMDDISKVNSITSEIMVDSDKLSSEVARFSDASTRAALFEDPAAAESVRSGMQALRSRMSLNVQKLASYSSSSVFDEKANIAMKKAEAEIARIDAAFPGLDTKSLMENSTLYAEAEILKVGPNVISSARMAGLYGNKASPEVTRAGLNTLALGDKIFNKQPITKAEALLSPLSNYNVLMTGLSTGVADNAADAKRNYVPYTIAYMRSTLPFISNLSPGPGKPATEVRAVTDYTNSMDGVLAVNNRNEFFTDDLWNAAAEKGDKKTQDMIAGVRLNVLNGYSRSVYMEITQMHPELAPYIRARDFNADANKNNMSSVPLAVVGDMDAGTRKQLDSVIARYRDEPSYSGFYKKTEAYYNARGQAITKEAAGFAR